jgi:t-SNARE complex subunit (syntaxin)
MHSDLSAELTRQLNAFGAQAHDLEHRLKLAQAEKETLLSTAQADKETLLERSAFRHCRVSGSLAD